MSTDSDILNRSRAAPAVFSELYDRHAPAIHRYAARRIGEHAADDVMSETFLVAFERRADFDVTRDDARPWLYGIATTLIKKHARLEARSWRGLVAGAAADRAAEGAHDAIEAVGVRVDAEVAMRRLASVLKRMPARDRDALLLYAWGDLDYEGVAQALGVPIGTVRSRLNRARQKLRAAVASGSAQELEVDHGRFDPLAHSAQ
ncbi:RNA polymerase sigma factor [Leifsonia kafniensis]|uniref:RNA polymerase sigma factor n=1 Tax=Leifsonia kafniensis TaxID=475957 RepID=A0ABP7L201_9MICO